MDPMYQEQVQSLIGDKFSSVNDKIRLIEAQ